MSKREFLDELRMALASRVSTQEVTEHIRYYEDYINTQVRMGKTEAQVVAELGDPRLLARNIAESKKYASGEKAGNYHAYEGNTAAPEGKSNKSYGWIIALVIFLCLFLIFGLVFSVLSFLAPILIPILLVVLLVKLVVKNT